MRTGEDTALRVRSFYQRELTPGEAVFDEGDPGDQLYVIQAGEIELTREGVGEPRVVARLGPGDFFGELSVVLGKRRTTRAVAVRNTRLLALDRDTLEAMCLAQPEIAIRMIRVLVSRLIEAERRLAALGIDDLLRPMVRTLVRRAGPSGNGNGQRRISTTLGQLAEGSGLSMLDAHRALHQLIDRRIVDLVDDCLIVQDFEALSACLDTAD